MKIRITADVELFYFEEKDLEFLMAELRQSSAEERLLLSIENDYDDTILGYVKVISYE